MVKINKKVIWIFVIIGIIFVGIGSTDLVEENETISFLMSLRLIITTLKLIILSFMIIIC